MVDRRHQMDSGRPNEVTDPEIYPAQHKTRSGTIALVFLVSLCLFGGAIYFGIPH